MDWRNILTKLEAIELSTGSIAVALITLVIVSILMFREFMTWMVKTNQVRQEINALSEQIKKLQESIKQQENLITEKTTDQHQANNSKAFNFVLDADQPKQKEFEITNNL